MEILELEVTIIKINNSQDGLKAAWRWQMNVSRLVDKSIEIISYE